MYDLFHLDNNKDKCVYADLRLCLQQVIPLLHLKEGI